MRNSLSRLLRGALLASCVSLAAPAAGASALSGAYLAAMQADFRDDYAAAADYYARALARDRDNPGLMQNSVVVRTAAGDVTGAREIADRLNEQAPGNQIATLVQISDDLAAEEYTAVAEAIVANQEALNPLLGGLLSAWTEVGRENFDAARELFDSMTGNEALEAYGKFHKALALASAGDFVTAETIMAGTDGEPLHLNRTALLAHAQILAQIGREKEALELLEESLSGGVPDAALISLRDRLASGEEVPFSLIPDARSGAAESFLTLADALDSPESSRVALIHARLAAHIDPSRAEAALMTAELLEDQGQYELAAGALTGVAPDSPWFVTASIRQANTQQAIGDDEGGIATLQALAESNADQIEVHSALGDALRSTEQYEEAVAAYNDALGLVPDPQQAHWVLFYTRGIANERLSRWDDAESDFRKALELEPDQPLVLNYLGYSMVENKRNLDEALSMIETAVDARPSDGYITDSLGWVLYRLGRHEEAVPHMLRAVELTPDDPIINDHLGDVLWMVGRKREAEFQWRRALSFGPADDLDMDRVRLKLEIGLDRVIEEHGDGTEG